MYIIILRRNYQMKKNMSKLVAQIGRSSSAARKDTFKVTSRNVNEYVNKILVDEEAYNQPGITETYIREEMKLYQNEEGNKNVADLNENVKKKTEKHKSIEHQLNLLQRNYNILALEELMASIRVAKMEEMMKVRDKLTKLENSLSFTLENEDLEPHVEEYLNQFLEELTNVINKPPRVY